MSTVDLIAHPIERRRGVNGAGVEPRVSAFRRSRLTGQRKGPSVQTPWRLHATRGGLSEWIQLVLLALVAAVFAVKVVGNPLRGRIVPGTALSSKRWRAAP
jgi:hypothetical protein